MSTKIKILIALTAMLTIFGTNILKAQSLDFSESTEESIVESGDETIVVDEEEEEQNSAEDEYESSLEF
jgi:uncharacterized membrane protein